MIKILAQIDTADYFELDVDQSELISLTRQLVDITDLNSRRGDFTKTFFLPATPSNVRYFGTWSDWNFQSAIFNQYNIIPCLLFDDEYLILSGNLKLEKFDRLKMLYEVVVYGQLNVLTNIIQEKYMSEIAGTNFWGHDYNQTNILASWNLGLNSGKVVYPLVDRGTGYGYNSYDITKLATPALLGELSPALKLIELLADLFESHGLVLGNKADLLTDYGKIFMQLTEDVPAGQPATKTFDAVYDVLQPDYILQTTLAKVPFLIPAGDPDYSNPDYEFTAPYDGTYYFSVLINTNGGISTYTNYFEIWLNGVLDTSYNQAQNIANFELIYNMTLTAGDTLIWWFRTSNVRSENKITAGSVDYWKLTYLDTAELAPAFYDPITLMTSLKQITFLKELMFVFNSIIIPDPKDIRKYYFRNIQVWYESGGRKNWTNKIDLSKEIFIAPTNDLLKRNVIISWKDSDDYLNKFYREETGVNYGTFQGDLDISNAEEATVKSNLFVPYPTDYVIDRPDIFIPKWLVNYTDLGLQKPSGYQLFIYNGQGTSGNYRVGFQGNLPSVIAIWPQASNFELIGGVVTVNSKDWNFGYSPPFTNTWSITGVPENNIYFLAWRNFIIELYNPVNRIVKAYFKLTADDIENTELNDLIQLDLDGSPADFRIQKIKNYKLNQTNSTLVELTKAVYGITPSPKLLFRIVANGADVVDDLDQVDVLNTGVDTAIYLGRRVISNDGSTGNVLTYSGAEYSVRPNLPFTIGLWAEFGAVIRTDWLNKGGETTREFAFTMAGGNINLILYAANTATFILGYCTAPATVEWKNVVATYDGSGLASGIQIYINGVAQTMITNSSGTWSDVPRNGAVQSIRVFSDGTTYAGAFNFDLLRFYTDILSENEIFDLYANEKKYFGL